MEVITCDKKGTFHDIDFLQVFAHMPIIRDIIYGAATYGVSIDELCDKVNIKASDLHDSEKKLDFASAYRVWEEAVLLTKDKLLGLHLGEITSPTILGMVGHLMQVSETLKDAFESVSNFGRVATDMFKYSIRRKDGQYVLTYEASPLWIKQSEDSARQATEQAMAGTLNVFFLLSGRIIPLKTTFRHKRAGQLAEYERLFHSPINFNAVANELIFSLDQLERKITTHDRSLHKVFKRILEEKKRTGVPRKFGDELKRIILLDFAGQPPAIEILASHVNIGVRSLQRKLRAENISYRELSSLIKRELARQLLSNSKTKVSYIASVLGYSEPSAFRRAYKSWTNTTPRKTN